MGTGIKHDFTDLFLLFCSVGYLRPFALQGHLHVPRVSSGLRRYDPFKGL